MGMDDSSGKCPTIGVESCALLGARTTEQSPNSGGVHLEGAQEEGQANLHRIIKDTGIEAGQRGGLLKAIAERIAMNTESGRRGRRAAILREEGIQRFEQL